VEKFVVEWAGGVCHEIPSVPAKGRTLPRDQSIRPKMGQPAFVTIALVAMGPGPRPGTHVKGLFPHHHIESALHDRFQLSCAGTRHARGRIAIGVDGSRRLAAQARNGSALPAIAFSCSAPLKGRRQCPCFEFGKTIPAPWARMVGSATARRLPVITVKAVRARAGLAG